MRSVADGLDDVAGQITGILNTVKTAAAAHDGCWGHDEFGDRFADGGSGYNERNPDLQTVLGSKVTLLQSYSKGLRDGATKFENTDQGNSAGF